MASIFMKQNEFCTDRSGQQQKLCGSYSDELLKPLNFTFVNYAFNLNSSLKVFKVTMASNEVKRKISKQIKALTILYYWNFRKTRDS